MRRSVFALCCAGLGLASFIAAAAEYNPVRAHPVSIGPETHRILVGFRTTETNATVKLIRNRMHPEGYRHVQAQTSAADAAGLAQRTGIALTKSRQITPSMHVLFLPKTLYGIEVQNALTTLRADAAVAFAEVDERRYPSAAGIPPNDPFFVPTPNAVPPASGQWYLQKPSANTIMLEGIATQDLSATDTVSAWLITTGSSDIVIADVDTGILFDHPDLLRSDLGGRLLPGYDFVGEDYNPNSPYNALGTYLIANDGDGWDPDPSDPGDWISASDQNNPLFSSANCGGTFDSSWHGTRVVGIFGAIANNNTGIAGLTWGPWVLPVRALGKCGGYDSDIIAGIEWAAGMTVTPPDQATSITAVIPDNPYPADIINLSLGGSSPNCPSTYRTALNDVNQLGTLVVIAAGNGGTAGQLAPVDAPANCSAAVSGVIAVAGLRNVGTKVGYSSFGPEVGVGAPAGNCLQVGQGQDCLRSIDTTTNDGLTSPDPAGNGYTNEQNSNLGTSFSTPIVAGIAALMRSVNANLTPAQLVARLESSATPFPANTGAVPVCPSNDSSSGECSCLVPSGMPSQCGTGMVNALRAVKAAQAPIGVVTFPAMLMSGSVLDASASVAACGLSIASYAWSTNTAGLITAGANTSKVTINPGSGGTLTLTITDSAGNVDVESVTVSSSQVTNSTAPKSSGTNATACPKALAVNPAAPSAPTIMAAFAPATVGENSTSTLTITFNNANGFDLTQSNFNYALPAGLAIPVAQHLGTTCFGTAANLTNTTTSLALTTAVIPANGSCSITVPVQSATAGPYTATIQASALTTAPAGANAAAAPANLTVNAPSGGGGGGGALEWPDLLLVAGALIAGRGRAIRRFTHKR